MSCEPPRNGSLDCLDDLRSRLSSNDQFPSFSKTIQALLALDSSDELSAEDLARVILGDYGLIGRVLKMINSVYYNRVGREVTTVTQAVILLGFDTIRQIALGMAVLDLIPERASGPLGRLLAQAFLAAHLAQGLEESSHGQRPEEAFLEALFHPLARITVAIEDEELYRRLSECERTEDQDGVDRLFRFWSGLGQDLGRAWKLPSNLGQHLEGAPEARSPAVARRQRLTSLTHAFARSVVQQMAPAGPLETVKALEKHTRLPGGAVMDQVRQALRQTAAMTPAFRLLCAGQALDTEQEGAPGPSLDSAGAPAAPDEGTPPGRENQESLFLELLTQLSESLTQERLSLHQIYLVAAEALYRGLGLDTVLLCLLTPDRKTLTVRYGIGDHVESFRTRVDLSFPPRSPALKTAFDKGTESLGRMEEISGGEDGLPETHGSHLCVSPLVIKGRGIGCFLLGRGEKQGPFASDDLRRVRTVRHLIVLATQRRTRP